MTVRSNHNSLLNYFLYDKRDLSPAYARKCEEFIDNLGSAKLADCFKISITSLDLMPSSPMTMSTAFFISSIVNFFMFLSYLLIVSVSGRLELEA